MSQDLKQKQKQQEVGSLLKAVLTSFGGKLPINKLNTEYRTVVGADIPHRELMYSTLTSFLQSIPDVLKLERDGVGQVIANVVADKNINLILRHVQEQKVPAASKSKSTRMKTMMHAPRRLHSSALQPASQPNWYSSRYNWYQPNRRQISSPREASRNHSPALHNGPTAPQPGLNHRTQGLLSLPGNRWQPEQQKLLQNQVQQQQQILQKLRQQQQQLDQHKQQQQQQLQQQVQQQIHQQVHQQVQKQQQQQELQKQQLQQKQQKQQELQKQHLQQQELQKQQQQQLQKQQQQQQQKQQQVQQKQQLPAIRKPPLLKSPGKKTYKQQLMEAVEALGYASSKPVYQTLRYGKKTQEWCTTIIIGSQLRVSSYPISLKTPEQAEESASEIALQYLPQLVKQQEVAQHTTTADYTVSVQRVKELLEDRYPLKPLWWEALQATYRKVYQENLPQDWITTVKSKNNISLKFDNPCLDKWTVALAPQVDLSDSGSKSTCLNTTPSPPPLTPSPPRASTPKSLDTTPVEEQPHLPCESEEEGNSSAAGRELVLPPLVLPSTPTWDVLITCVKDPNDINVRLVGEEYSDKYDELVSQMESHYTQEEQQPVTEPVEGNIYAAKFEESWFRVKVLETLDEDMQLVEFVDEGDTTTTPLCDLFDLQERFYSLPPQDLHCCLAGLEDAPREATLQAFKEVVPMSQAVVARVQRHQEPYALVIFDTSTNEDINLNDKVFESLVQHLNEPSLPPVGYVAEVYLTYASHAGIIYFQEDSDTLKTLSDLLKITRRRSKEMDADADIDLDKLYLACFSGDGEWYRAAPKSPVDAEGKVLMEFVDFGNLEKVSINNIRNFEDVASLLAKVPYQALPCQLYKVPGNSDLKWTVQACQRLVEMTALDTTLLLKVMVQGTSSQLPLVQIFKRLLPQNELVSINDTLVLDTKLFSKDDKNNNVDKDGVLCHSRSQLPGASGAALTPEPRTVGSDSLLPCSPMSLSDIPEIGSHFDVIVTFAASPNLFAVQPWNMDKKYGELSDSMQKHYNNPLNHRQVTEIKGGQYCALKQKDVWYRAKVEMTKNETVAGMFVDFGDHFVSSLQEIQPLLSSFCILPCLAIKAKLNGIAPLNKSWSIEDALHFRSLTAMTGNKHMSSVVYGKEVDQTGSLQISLLLIDTTNKDFDIFINQLFVEENRAVYTWAGEE